MLRFPAAVLAGLIALSGTAFAIEDQNTEPKVSILDRPPLVEAPITLDREAKAQRRAIRPFGGNVTFGAPLYSGESRFDQSVGNARPDFYDRLFAR